MTKHIESNQVSESRQPIAVGCKTTGYAFGQIVNINGKYARYIETRIEKNPWGKEYKASWKVWRKVPCEWHNCILIGFRTLKNGRRDWDSECGWIFSPKEHIKAALVAIDMRQKPVLVPLDCIEA